MTRPKKTLISITKSVKKDYGFSPPGKEEQVVPVRQSQRRVETQEKQPLGIFGRRKRVKLPEESFVEAIEPPE